MSIDCVLNLGQTNFTVEKLMALAANRDVRIRLSDQREVPFAIGDKPHTDACDYMETCEYTCSPADVAASTEVVMDTYSEPYMKTNYANILKRVQQLYRERVVYTREALVRSVNITRVYPIDQILYVMTSLLQNGDHLVDKYGRAGRLVNRGIYYLFQPLEVTNENASMFERTVPVDYKRRHIEMELPKDKVTELDTEAVAAAEAVPIQVETATADSLLLALRENIAQTQRKDDIVSGDTNWYQHAAYIMEFLRDVHGVSDDAIVRTVVYHYLDTLTLENKLLLVSHVYAGQTLLEIETIIKSYFDDRRVDYQGTRGIVLASGETYVIYVQDPKQPDLWTEARPSERDQFISVQSGFMKLILRKADANPLVVFMTPFKENEKEIVFKTKDLRERRNNKGVYCNIMLKADVIKRLNLILGESMYSADNVKSIVKFSMCVLLEILLRHFNDTKRNGKVWFLDTERALINRVASLNAATMK
jgi:hypothetical protein